MNEIGRKYLPHELPLFVQDERPVFLITMCAREREDRPFLSEGIALRLIEAAKFYHERGRWWVYVLVVMPDHLHLVASFDGEMKQVVNDWRRWTAGHLGVAWQKDFFDHRIRHDESLREKIDYVLMNPVRAGWVEDWQEWKFWWMGE